MPPITPVWAHLPLPPTLRFCGEAQSISVLKNKATGTATGTALVIFKADKSAREAVQLNGSLLMPFRVPVAVFKKPPPPQQPPARPAGGAEQPSSNVWRREAKPAEAATAAAPGTATAEGGAKA